MKTLWLLKMAIVNFTNNLKRHLECPPQQMSGETLKDVLNSLFKDNRQLASYLVNDQNVLRKHVMISIDNQLINDRIHFTDPVKPDSEVYIFQALSGG